MPKYEPTDDDLGATTPKPRLPKFERHIEEALFAVAAGRAAPTNVVKKLEEMGLAADGRLTRAGATEVEARRKAGPWMA